MGVVDVKHTGDHELTLEWESSSSNDMIADSTLALITGIDTSPASVKRRSLFIAGILIHADLCPFPLKKTVTTSSHFHSHSPSFTPTHSHPHADPEGESSSVMRIQRLAMFLEAHFGEVELHMPEPSEEEPESGEDDHREPSLLVVLDDAEAQISLVTLVSSSFSLNPTFFIFLFFVYPSALPLFRFWLDQSNEELTDRFFPFYLYWI